MSLGQVEHNFIAHHFNRAKGKLCDVTKLVFDINIQIVSQQHAFSQMKNFRELGGGQPVIGVICRPGLEAA